MDRLEPDERRSGLAMNGASSSLPSGEPAQSALGEEADSDEEQTRSWFSEFGLPIGLFVLTIFTTLWAGAYQTKTTLFQGPWKFLMADPTVLWKGIPFSATLLGILVTHELGHYLLSRIHRTPASLPLFIPGFPQLVGTFGAIIRMRRPITNRKALFDIGVARP
ncbi:MAG TPA: site-2 protease family protein, partial [Nitrospiraceae bacterium]|nr:site-2 protease family protein [Nitrospiraceae bacterium]